MKRLIKIPFYLIILAILGIISGYFTFKLLSFGKTVEMPDLRGKGMVESGSILRSKGLHIRLESEDYDSYIPQGYIIRQDIPAGNKVKEGREIGVVLSKGPRVKYVPDVVGQPLSTAEAILKEKGISISKIIYSHSENVVRDIIIAQRPEPTERDGENFRVVVSLGSFEKEGM